MKKSRCVKAAVALACCGLLLQGGPALAGGPAKNLRTSQTSDVALSGGGTLTGQVVNSQGLGLDGAQVVVRQGDKTVAQTVANKDGYFSVNNLRGGTYQVQAGNGVGMYRLWTTKSAPRSAKPRALLVSGNTVVRGQGGMDFITLTTVVASGTAAGFSIAAYSKAKDAADNSEQAVQNTESLQEQVDAIAASTD